MDKETVIALMRSSSTAQEWNENCRKVKKAMGGVYPDFWYAEILASGLAKEVMAEFGETPEIKVR